MSMTSSEFLTVAQVARELCLSVRGVNHRIQKGQLRATKFGDGKTSPYAVARDEVDRAKAAMAGAAGT